LSELQKSITVKKTKGNKTEKYFDEENKQ